MAASKASEEPVYDIELGEAVSANDLAVARSRFEAGADVGAKTTGLRRIS